MTCYTDLISASRSLLEKIPCGSLKTTAKNGIKLGVPGFGDSSTHRIIWWTSGPHVGRDAVYVPVWNDLDPTGREADDIAAFIAHARTALPLALQGLEDALLVIEAVRASDVERAIETLREMGCNPDDARLMQIERIRAALARFDARERAQSTPESSEEVP